MMTMTVVRTGSQIEHAVFTILANGAVDDYSQCDQCRYAKETKDKFHNHDLLSSRCWF
jgi:hypothetical protein